MLLNDGSGYIMEESNEKVDRISRLPEALLHHIMSFLSFKQVVQTSVLSKTWEGACNTLPILVFDKTFFKKDWQDRLNYYDEKREMIREVKFLNLCNYVEETVKRRHKKMISIKYLILDLSFMIGANCLSVLENCICYAIESNVKGLKIIFPLGIEPSNLLQMVLCSESMNVLVIQGCKLESPRSVKLSSLRKLHLQVFAAQFMNMH